MVDGFRVLPTITHRINESPAKMQESLALKGNRKIECGRRDLNPYGLAAASS